MKIYHAKTQADYDSLMIELEEKGYNWLSGYKPTFKNYWFVYKEDTCAKISGKNITFDSIESNKKECPDIPIIEYKAKGEKMTQEEMKQKLEEILHDVSVAVGWGLRDSTVESDLQEAKLSAKKLIEKIDEYLESRKPKPKTKPEFKVGDIIVSQCFSNNGFGLVRLNKELINWLTSIDGLWYTKDNCVISDLSLAVFKEDTRLATAEEVSEYESALTFNENGRKPFELKKGDLLYDKNSENNFTYSGLTPNMTINKLKTGEYIFVKTREEVNEWLENK